MNGPLTTTAAADLLPALERADAALSIGDMDAASAAMESAAELCQKLQTAGVGVPPGDLGVLRELAGRCGKALERLGQELQADSHRDDNHRRGISSYHANQRR